MERFLELIHERFEHSIIESGPNYVVFDSDEASLKADEFIFSSPEMISLRVNYILQGRSVFVNGYSTEDDFFDF